MELVSLIICPVIQAVKASHLLTAGVWSVLVVKYESVFPYEFNEVSSVRLKAPSKGSFG